MEDDRISGNDKASGNDVQRSGPNRALCRMCSGDITSLQPSFFLHLYRRPSISFSLSASSPPVLYTGYAPIHNYPAVYLHGYPPCDCSIIPHLPILSSGFLDFLFCSPGRLKDPEGRMPNLTQFRGFGGRFALPRTGEEITGTCALKPAPHFGKDELLCVF